jgi:uncharacterized Rossmann fold enzyme
MPAEGAVSVDHCIVVIGGDAPDRRWQPIMPRDAIVIAADSGVDHALAAGLRVDVAVGDGRQAGGGQAGEQGAAQ